jgi:antirestriction protein ArdC
MAENRPGNTKYFSVPAENLAGFSQKEKYGKYDNYRAVKEMKEMCISYAMAYADTMLTRLDQEQPEYFEDAENKSKAELTLDIATNMCLKVTKYHSRVFRDTHAQVIEKDYLND